MKIKKKCSKCGEVKLVSEFCHRKKGSLDGFRSNCKQCDKVYRDAYRSNPENRKKEKLSHKKWRDNHKEEIREYNKKWNAENKILKKELRRSWHIAHKESENNKSRKKMKEWTQKNPERHNANNRKYRARKAQAKGSHTLWQWNKLVSFFNGVCPCCKKKSKLTLDHIIPLNKNGSDYIDNIQPLCKSCNSAKMDLMIVDYRPKNVRKWAANVDVT